MQEWLGEHLSVSMYANGQLLRAYFASVLHLLKLMSHHAHDTQQL